MSRHDITRRTPREVALAASEPPVARYRPREVALAASEPPVARYRPREVVLAASDPPVARCVPSHVALALALHALALGACAGSPAKLTAVAKRPVGLSAQTTTEEADRCAVIAGRQAQEYDVNGDGRPDVRKVFVAISAGLDSRTVMICRQLDLDGDGRKDVVRWYDDEGRSLREDSDRDFDGRFDRALVFQDGQLFAEELDENRDGKIDTKIFYEKGQISRAERDLGGRSTAEQWHADRWEYYEAGHMVRMGTDLDGDARVDRWDRDRAYKRSVPVGSAPPAAAPQGGS